MPKCMQRTTWCIARDVVYRTSPDFRELHPLEGRSFIPDEAGASQTWLDKYIDPDPEDQSCLSAAIDLAVRTRSPWNSSSR